MTTQDAAVMAAAEAIRAAIRSDEDYAGGPTALSRVAVAAARPIIEAEARERIAAEIEAEAASLRATEQPDYIRAALDLEVAARIARGTA